MIIIYANFNLVILRLIYFIPLHAGSTFPTTEKEETVICIYLNICFFEKKKHNKKTNGFLTLGNKTIEFYSWRRRQKKKKKKIKEKKKLV